MINKKIKQELDTLKETVRKKTNARYPISYNDVLKYLINENNNKQSVEYSLLESLIVGNAIRKKNLYVSTPLKKNSFSVGYKLD